MSRYLPSVALALVAICALCLRQETAAIYAMGLAAMVAPWSLSSRP